VSAPSQMVDAGQSQQPLGSALSYHVSKSIQKIFQSWIRKGIKFVKKQQTNHI
jgi:hypothetical protein